MPPPTTRTSAVSNLHPNLNLSPPLKCILRSSQTVVLCHGVWPGQNRVWHGQNRVWHGQNRVWPGQNRVWPCEIPGMSSG
ncbi:hypothetical protein XELAEV_18026181mg [Xenopus laevis]|uniref:Uncharacterized protein n=1 Tax=Xenopus laevis TaxID=8355 RepID=A0A974HIT5_XENLA|nr:hypothetical protein XELAEV_18026181mg [Xenopus laevis]